MGRIDPEGGVDRGVEVRDRHGVFEDVLTQFVRDTVGALMFQPATGKQQAEATALMSAPAATVIRGGTSEFGADCDQRLIKDALLLKVDDQSRKSDVEFFDEQVLILLAFVVSVPARAVDEVQVVGDFNETNTGLDKTPGEQATLSKFATVSMTQIVGLVLQSEVAHEIGAGQTHGF